VEAYVAFMKDYKRQRLEREAAARPLGGGGGSALLHAGAPPSRAAQLSGGAGRAADSIQESLGGEGVTVVPTSQGRLTKLDQAGQQQPQQQQAVSGALEALVAAAGSRAGAGPGGPGAAPTSGSL
jgi:hypothetical protein